MSDAILVPVLIAGFAFTVMQLLFIEMPRLLDWYAELVDSAESDS